MRNLIIILLSLAFVPTTNAQDIESQFYLLFDAMENGFKDDMKNPKRGDKHNEYYTLLAPGKMSALNGGIMQLDNGIVFYTNAVGNEGKDELIKVLEAFPTSRGYKVEILARRTDSYHYVIKKNTGKEIGFLKFRKLDGIWGFQANLPFDKYKFKSDINSILEYAKLEFKTIGKTYLQDTNDANIYNATKKINYVNEPIISVFKNKQLSLIYLGYKLTDFEALKYQIKEMNLSLYGYEKSIDENDEKQFSYLFKSKESKITLEISQKADPMTPSIIISHQKIKQQAAIAPSPQPKKNVFHKGIVKQVEEALWQTKGYQRHVDFFGERMAEARKKAEAGKQPEDMKYIFRPLKSKMEACGIGARAGAKEIGKAIEMAKKENCENTIAELEKFQKILYKAESHFYKAKDAYSKMEYTTSNRSKYLENSEIGLENFLAGIENIDNFRTGILASKMVNNNCADSGNSSSSSSSLLIFPDEDEWKKEDIITTDKSGKTDLVGVGIYLNRNSKKTSGVRASNTISGWAAYAAGIRESDYVIEVDGKKLKDIQYGSQYQEMLVGEVGTKVNIKYRKKGKIHEYILTRGAGGKAEKVVQKDEGVGFSVHQAASLTGEILVYQTTSDWAASQAGIRQNTVILEIDDVKITKDNRYKVKSMLEGTPGSTVKVKFAEKGVTTAKIYELERGKNGKATFLKNVGIIQPEKPKTPSPTTTSNENKTVGIGATYFQGKGSDLCEIMWMSKLSAASKAGLEEGDFILKVNGINAKGKGESDLKKIIDGKKGTTVKITVDRNGETLEFTVTR